MARAGPWIPQTTVGRYQLLTPLASGGMAEIWLARQPGVRGFEKLVVIKRMVGALEEDPDHVEMFLSEARLAAQLTHPHIVQIYELGEEQGSFYIVMEFVDGEPLSVVFREARRQDKPLSDQLAARLISWAAEGLHYAHTREDAEGRALCIVHRDVSPQNLLVTMDGSVKVVDFGIAKIASHATSSGKLKGKLAYMAPEQGRAENVDARTDVFALGLCLFELVTRTRLLPKADEMELLRFITSAPKFPRASERRADVPPALDAIIAKAMAAQPEERFQSARELQVALEDWLVSTGSRVTAGDVSVYLRSLFAERIATRKALIDAAKRGEILPTDGASFSSSPSGSGRSGSGSGSRSGAKPASSGAFAAVAPSATPARSSGKFAAVPPPADDLPESVDVSMSMTRAGVVPASAPRVHVGGYVIAALIALGGISTAAYIATRPAPVEAPQPPPAVQAATLSIEAEPAGAKVHIDGTERGAGPYTLEPGEHALEVVADGFVTDHRTVKLAAGERTSLIVKLEHEALAAAAPDAGASGKKPATVTRVQKGTLRLDTVPWTTVYLGGKKLGETPILGASLPAGRHVLRLVNSEQNIEHTVEVEISAGATTTKKLRLQ